MRSEDGYRNDKFDLKEKGSDRNIYSDSRIAMGWVKRKKCNTKLKKTSKNKKPPAP